MEVSPKKTPRSKCPYSLRGHTWGEPAPALLPAVPRRDLFALRVCLRCGELGRINKNGAILVMTSAEAKSLFEGEAGVL